MGTTYCVNNDLVLDSGKNLDAYLDVSLTDEEKITQKDKARERAYNFINDSYLVGRTVIPASHVPGLKQIEIDLVIADLMTDSFSMEMANTSDWTEKYKERAIQSLDNLKFVSSSEDATADSENTGNGTVSTIVTNNDFTRTEQFILRASSATVFSIHGSLHDYLPNLKVGVKYPERDWSFSIGDYGLICEGELRFEEFPISLIITAGSVPFSQDDKFVFKTFAASYYKNRSGKILRG